jgi:hypothetical protein
MRYSNHISFPLIHIQEPVANSHNVEMPNHMILIIFILSYHLLLILLFDILISQIHISVIFIAIAIQYIHNLIIIYHYNLALIYISSIFDHSTTTIYYTFVLSEYSLLLSYIIQPSIILLYNVDPV